MSIFSSIASVVGKVVTPFLGASKAAQPVLSAVSKVPLLGAALKAVPGIGTAITAGTLATSAYKALSASKAVVPVATSAAKGLSTLTKVGIGTAVAGGTAAAVSHFANTGQVPAGYHVSRRTGNIVRNRRMNVGNAKAARRAVRRIKGVRKLLMKIEREMPHRACKHTGGRSHRR